MVFFPESGPYNAVFDIESYYFDDVWMKTSYFFGECSNRTFRQAFLESRFHASWPIFSCFGAFFFSSISPNSIETVSWTLPLCWVANYILVWNIGTAILKNHNRRMKKRKIPFSAHKKDGSLGLVASLRKNLCWFDSPKRRNRWIVGLYSHDDVHKNKYTDLDVSIQTLNWLLEEIIEYYVHLVLWELRISERERETKSMIWFDPSIRFKFNEYLIYAYWIEESR